MKQVFFVLLVCVLAFVLGAQTEIHIVGTEKPTIAVPDFRGSGAAAQFMGTFNQTLSNALEESGQMRIVPKTMYPRAVPQQPSDFRPQGAAFTDWSNPPVSAKYLAFGYTAEQNGQLVLFGWLYDVTQPSPASAQLIGKLYFGSLDENGAKKVAQDFAADILKLFGATTLAGTKIYFVSDRTGHKEIWSMDYDGSNQKQITSYRSISNFPVVSPDGTKLAFTSWSSGQPQILMHSLVTGRKLPYYNQHASVNAASDFTPDSKNLLIYSTASGGYTQIYETDDTGGNIHRIGQSRSLEVEPKVNPKTGADLVFVSDRGGLPQIYRMSMDGTDVARLTNGEGEAVNPSWNPDGQHIAFAWTRGFAPGNYNLFIMDVATRQVNQLTSNSGRNENPSWAPDGVHIVFQSKRGGRTEIWTMRADGTDQRQLTNSGNNEKPVWSKGIQ